MPAWCPTGLVGRRGGAVHRWLKDRYLQLRSELRAAGASLRDIRRRLEAEQIPPRRGDRWHPEAARRMLQHEAPYALRPRTP
ncbi:recombinase family protein [Streptomyces sp. NPDC059037]|uniref:recombinase family protein n=1 Tax=Streptomyces sp. NPDC059037 TaxID=3346710 RepID=UPI0036C5536D